MATATESINKFRRDLFGVMRGTVCHASASAAVAEPDATDAASAVVLAEAIANALDAHLASVVDAATGVGAHYITTAAVDAPTTLPERAHALASALAAHMENAAVHIGADRMSGPIYSPRTGSTAELWLLLNSIKAVANAHFAASLASEIAV